VVSESGSKNVCHLLSPHGWEQRVNAMRKSRTSSLYKYYSFLQNDRPKRWKQIHKDCLSWIHSPARCSFPRPLSETLNQIPLFPMLVPPLAPCTERPDTQKWTFARASFTDPRESHTKKKAGKQWVLHQENKKQHRPPQSELPKNRRSPDPELKGF